MNWEKLLSHKRQAPQESEPVEFERYDISETEKDYHAIISSYAFRRLQDKTQVFPLDKSDFVRTRLTHSMEVSTIARQLGIMITKKDSQYTHDELKKDDMYQSEIPAILSCAGLLHDIGNPPFGHFGEVVIGDWFRNQFYNEDFKYKDKKVSDILSKQMMCDLANFEGNAQALRILSKVKNNTSGYDVNLSYSVLSALVKYPTSSLNFKVDSPELCKHKLGYYFSEENVFKDISDTVGTRFDGKYVRHPLAYLVEAADDISYATADLEDALKKEVFTLDQFIDFFEIELETISSSRKSYTIDLLNNLKQRISWNSKRSKESDLIVFQKWISLVRKWLMYVVRFRFSKSYDDIMNGTYEYDLFHNTNHEYTIRILKNAMCEFVFDDKEILKLELAAKKIISSLLSDFIYAVLYYDVEDGDYKLSKSDKKLIKLISENYKNDYMNSKTEDEGMNLYLRFLMVTDYISGMTDSYAKSLYNELNGIYVV